MDITTRRVSWDEVETWLRALIASKSYPDLIVGVARAGAPIAIALSYLLPHAVLLIANRTTPRGQKPESYDFDADRQERLTRLHRSLMIDSLPTGQIRDILVVDDVATSGDTLSVVELKLRIQYPNARISFAVFAADVTRVEAANSKLLKSLAYAIEIDNQSTWISFPWNLSAQRN
jgi:hypoxanthine phosphoribosyltransferase